MPVQCPSIGSKSNKTHGFSIDDIIKVDRVAPSSYRSPPSSTYLPPITWLPSSTNIYQLHRESVLQYLRHSHPFPNPEATAAFLLNSFRKPKRNRTAFTPAQLLKLENAFEKNHYIVGEERKELAKHLNLPETKVKVWYQNRRTKHKRLVSEDGNSSSNEPAHHPNESNVSDTPSATKNDDDADEHLWDYAPLSPKSSTDPQRT